uniref:Decaprenyl-diphosphate synthase subunit 1 n=3 Tax=Meloidogyne TaxID=189290 RepID=A0A915P5T1_9BILA
MYILPRFIRNFSPFKRSFSPQIFEAIVEPQQQHPVELPNEVTKMLGSLKDDILESLMERTMMNGLATYTDNPFKFTKELREMSRYYFDKGGKMIRPTISLLMSAACNQQMASSTNSIADISLNQYRIAIVAEMIHSATLVHDDVIDESNTRRGQPTTNARWGNKRAILIGDFILARATKVLCSIGQPQVIETMAVIVEDLVKGELLQLNSPPQSKNARFKHYMTKTFYKTGSLFSNSCKSAAMLSGCSESTQHLASEFGRNLGLAFQLIDDVLDYVASASELGKPTASDLRLGLATCPVLFAADEFPELDPLIERRFSQPGDVEKALELVKCSNGLQNSRKLARQHGEAAIENIRQLLPQRGQIHDCLVNSVLRQLERQR